MYHTVGVFSGEGPPVPIPNTEVKLTCAENTCLATDWEDRSMPTHRAIQMNGSFFAKIGDAAKALTVRCVCTDRPGSVFIQVS